MQSLSSIQGHSRRHHAITALVLTLLAITILVGASFAEEGDDNGKTILKFNTMIGDPGSGPANVIRGVQGAGAPWVILRSVRGELRTNGRLTIFVRGLVIPIAPFNNSNPSPMFGAELSCQDPTDSTKSVLFSAGTFPATTGADAGDANIVAKLTLPNQCTAPVILITSPGGAWFAATGWQTLNSDSNMDQDNH
jgi:hypothetical protein